MNTPTLPTLRLSASVRLRRPDDGELETLEQGEGGEGGGADGEALGYGGGGVAERVEGIGDFADRGVEFGHLGDTAGVVGDGPVGVNRDHHAGGGQHADGGHGDAVDAAESDGNGVVGVGQVLQGHFAAPEGDGHMPMRTRTTEAATDTMPAEMPPRTVVAGPVSDCWAIFLTGPK